MPGRKTEIVTALFARGEAFDSQGFTEFFVDNPVYQFGNFEPCLDKGAIFESVKYFFSQVSALYHDIKMMWETGNTVIVEMDVMYWRKDGSLVTLPCADIFRFEGEKVAELRIFMDANPVGNASIPVSDTSSIMTLKEGSRYKSTDVMKKFFYRTSPRDKKESDKGLYQNGRSPVPVGLSLPKTNIFPFLTITVMITVITILIGNN